MGYWLMKSEPSVFGIDDLAALAGGTEHWDGIRNYQARNMIRDQMQPGDQALFYHSSCDDPGVVGIMEIASKAYPDPSALDPGSEYYDPKSTATAPRWFVVDVRFVRKLKRTIALPELKQQPELSELALVRRGNRLSVMPVSAAQWEFILALE